MKKKIISLIICTALAVTLVLPFSTAAHAVEEIDIDAAGVLLMEPTTDTVLYAENESAQLAPASTTKVMTVLLALRAIESGAVTMSDVVTIPDDVYYDIPWDGSTAELQPGYQVTLEELLYCAMLPSANEACNAIAVYLSGSVSDFVAQMNSTAVELGCTGTNFENPHGLPSDNHYTTANDLYLIFKEACKYEEFIKISGTPEYVVSGNETHDRILIDTTNQLLIEDGRYAYPNCVAGKTGYTDSAGFCLVSKSEWEDISFVAVILGATNVTEDDGSTTAMSFKETIRLYEWTYNNYEFREILSEKELLAEVAIEMGHDADSVLLHPASSVTALVEKASAEDDITYDIRVYSEEDGTAVTAPVSAGDPMGEITVAYKGVSVETVKLVANTSVALSKADYVKQEVTETFNSPVIKFIIIAVIVIFILYIIFVIRYNQNRKKRRRKALQKAREEALSRNRNVSTTDKTFEEIERIFAEKD